MTNSALHFILFKILVGVCVKKFFTFSAFSQLAAALR